MQIMRHGKCTLRIDIDARRVPDIDLEQLLEYWIAMTVKTMTYLATACSVVAKPLISNGTQYEHPEKLNRQACLARTHPSCFNHVCTGSILF